jgi:hypothetical protein
MSLRSTLTGALVIACALVGALIAYMYLRPYLTTPGARSATPQQRQALFEMLQPVTLRNCQLERFGEAHDGGYVMCGNLLEDVKSAYSYGISGYDKWGCDVSMKRHVTVHQYDCFDLTRPACPGGTTTFHPECVADARKVEEGRVFDTIAAQIAGNGDTAKRLVVKMDVEGAEWQSLLSAPDSVLEQIDQLAIEFHWIEDGTSVALARRLKQFFEVAHLHINNATCTAGMEPFRGWAYEVLFVNKRVAIVDGSVRSTRPSAFDAPNIPFLPDCQP